MLDSLKISGADLESCYVSSCVKLARCKSSQINPFGSEKDFVEIDVSFLGTGNGQVFILGVYDRESGQIRLSASQHISVTARPAVLRPHAPTHIPVRRRHHPARACPALIPRLARCVTRATSRSASPFTQRAKDVQKTELLGSPEQGRPKKLLLVSTSSRFAIRPFRIRESGSSASGRPSV